MSSVGAVGLAVWVAIAAAGCKKGAEPKQQEQAQPAAEQPAARAQRPALDSARPRLQRQQRRIDPIAIGDAEAVLSVPDGATVVSALAKPAQGERVQATYCFQNMDAAAAAASLQKMLEGAGWANVHVRTRPDSPDRAAVAAQRPPLRTSVSIRRVPAPGCNGDAGHSLATLTVHKIAGLRPLPVPAREGRP